ncbi:MAG: MarR family winged helix-turn-helix transcriptional regulator [Armatimonadota bacterium]
MSTNHCDANERGGPSLPWLILRAKRLLKRHFQAAVLEHGLTDGQFRVLRRLWQGDAVTIGELARDLCLDAATVTGLVDRLEAKDLVCRRRDAEDRRSVQVVLTEAGRSLEGVLEAAGRLVEQKALTGICDEDVKRLLILLEQVCTNLEDD